VTSIADTNFTKCGSMKILAPRNSYAYRWAVTNNFPVEEIP
jgi:hypothetical protein